ncbi:hypothetical protein RD149_10675 [Gordonia westfalica]|uniref:Uncharacterized protein n=1 Tax=Gordonia westfalica TaxID=158898 RepID=A0ABU2GS12_9ACTN|nr:hypothetical protein [Gordonia westfalica]
MIRPPTKPPPALMYTTPRLSCAGSPGPGYDTRVDTICANTWPTHAGPYATVAVRSSARRGPSAFATTACTLVTAAAAKVTAPAIRIQRMMFPRTSR